MTIKNYLLIAAKVLALCLVLLGIIYPIIVFIGGQVIFPFRANGSLIREGKRVVGSALIAQEFSLPQYFQSRPSAVAYDPRSSGGSNLAATSSRLLEIYRDRIEVLRAENAAGKGKIPLELVSLSASGLDPHISLGAALWQIPRIAGARNLSSRELEGLIRESAEPPLFGFFGEWRINVLLLNRHLDRSQARGEDRKNE